VDPCLPSAAADHPERDDILSRLLKSTFPDAIGFDDDRIATNIMSTLVGGGETTSQAIVQILDQLFQRPTDLAEATCAAKADDDALLYSYCWEALRFNPVNPFVIRRYSKDYRIASGTLRAVTIRAGKIVLVSTRSAMRGGRELPAAGSFAIDRPPHHYMHLGYGMHTCLGDHVSRVQVPEIVKRLLKLPGVRPTGPIDFKGGAFPESYVLEFD
jgi:cytochrome P450